MNYTFGLSVTVFNITILVILLSSYIYHRIQIRHLENEEREVDYFEIETLYKAGEISFKLAVKAVVSNILSKLAIKFHVWMFYVNGFLLVANTFAFITGIFGYFIYKIDSPDIMLFGRVSDRYIMLLAYIGLAILGRSIFKRPVLIENKTLS